MGTEPATFDSALGLLASDPRGGWTLLRGHWRGGSRDLLALVERAPTSPPGRLLDGLTALLHPRLGVILAEDRTQDGPVLLLQDPGGASLASLRGSPVDPAPAVRLAEAMTTALVTVHSAGYVHGRLELESFVLDADGEPVLVELFALAMPSPTPDPWDRRIPEHGRHPLDARSDLYLLGALLYELLTGRQPLPWGDPLERHQVLAGRVPATDTLVPTIPEGLSRIVLRLLHPDPANRYPDARTLLADLAQATALLAETGTVPPFPLAVRERPRAVRIVEATAAREAERSALADALANAAAGASLRVEVVGAAGMGKSQLLETLRAPTLARGGCFGRGRADPVGAPRPLGALAGALDEILVQILGGDAARLERVRRVVARELGPNVRLITTLNRRLKWLVPEEELAGPDDAGEHRDEGIAAAAARLEDALERLLSALAQAAPPLVLAVDDLHSADVETLALLRRLGRSPSGENLLVLVAWSPEGPTTEPLGLPSPATQRTQRLTLGGLESPALAELLTRCLGDGGSATPVLAQLAFRRTGGNPMLVRAWVRQLAAAGAVAQDDQGRFTVDFAIAATVDAGSNVAAALVRQLDELAAPVREALAVAARIGESFPAGFVAELLGSPVEGTVAQLTLAAQAGVVAPVPFQGDAKDTWRFLHDRLHQASLNLLDRDEGVAMHARIGASMCATIGPDPEPEILLRAVHQCNLGASTLTTTAARDDLARWNGRAAAVARATGSFAAALGFVDAAIALLGPDPWRLPADAVPIYMEGTRAAVLAAPACVDAYLRPLLAHVEDPLLAADALELGVDHHLIRYDAVGALAATRAALGRLGYVLPERVNKLQVGLAVVRAQLALRGRTPEQLLALPAVQDPRAAAVLRVLLRGSTAAYLLDPDLFAYISCEMVRYGLGAGACPGTAWGLIVFAILQSAAFGDIEGGYRQGDIARRMLQRFAPHGFGAKFGSVWLVTQVPTHHPLRASLEPLRDWFRLGLADGDSLHAGINAAFYLNHLVFSGEPLERVTAEGQRLGEEMRLREQGVAVETSEPFIDLARALHGLVDPFAVLDAARAEVPAAGPAVKPFRIFSVHFCMCALAVFAGRDSEALLHACRADPMQAAILGTVNDPLFQFFAALAAGRLLATNADRSWAARKRLRGGLTTMRRRARANPVDYASRVALLEGLLAAWKGHHAAAFAALDLAAHTAQARGAPHEAALAFETAARLHTHLGSLETARLLRGAAVAAWRAWGAEPLVTAALPTLGPALPAPAPPLTAPGVEVVLRATQALAGDVSRDALLASVVRLAGMQSGAERVILLGGGANNLLVRAILEDGATALVPGIALGAFERACGAAARLAVVTGELVLEPEANRPGAFGLDPWVRAAGVRSVLAMPISLRGALKGVLLLEDTRQGAAFGATDVTALRILATVAAALLENAELLGALEDRAGDLRAANEALQEQSRLLEEAVAARTRELDTLTRLQASILDALSEGLCGLDAAGRVTFANPAAARLLGTPIERLVGVLFHDTFHIADDTDEPGAPCALCTAAEPRQDVPARLRGPEDEVRWVECAVQPIRGRERSGTRVLSFRDVGRRRELEAQVRHAQKMEAIGLFVGGVAHEFNNLLTPILGRVEMAQFLLEPDHKVQDSLASVSRAGRRAADLVKQLLALGRRTEVIPQPTDVSGAVQEALRFLSPSIDRRITVTYAPPGVAVWAFADQGQVHQILLNLCLNARDALLSAPHTRGPPRIDIRVRQIDLGPAAAAALHPSARPGRWVELEVEDNGPGMPPAVLARIFEPFFTTKEMGSGSGLGLAVLHGIVQQHGGWVSVDTAVGVGSTFRCTFPAIEPELAVVTGPQPVPAVPQRHRRVLVVDDEPMVRDLVRTVLEHAGYQVDDAANGREAIARITADLRPDLVILDLVMPEMDGWQTLAQLRELQPDLPVVLLSGFDPLGAAEHTSTPDVRMHKPFHLKELLATVSELLEPNATRVPPAAATGPRAPGPA